MNLQEVYQKICKVVQTDEALSDEERYELMFGTPYIDRGDLWEKAKIKQNRKEDRK